ncbi:MAG: MFS transporter [Candidatus Eremiobacteraeota bacterium]|nr:MFS transporter [Candidatus Eremiobacteraeota bacterium]
MAESARVAGHTLERGHLALLLTLGLGVFAGALDLGVLSPALPALALDYGVAPREAAWVFTLYLFANVVAIPIASKCADLYGRRVAYLTCVAVFAAGSVLAILAPSFWVFLLARAIQAAGAGGIFPVATAAIADVVPVERRGSALGILGAIWGLAAIVGPIFGGFVTHVVSWHWIFAANVPLALVVIALARTRMPSTAPRRRGPLDVAGLASLAVLLLGIMAALSFAGTALAGAALAVAIVALVALIAAERRALEPVLSPAMFASRQLIVTYALEIAIGALEGALFFIPAALVAGERMNYAAAGGVAAIGALVFVAVIPVAGRALDRFGSRTVLTCGALCSATGLTIFALGFARLPTAVAGILIAGIGFGALLGAPTRYIVSNETTPRTRATAVGLLSIFLIVGQIVGGSLAGGLVGAHIGEPEGYRRAYEAFAALAVVAAIGTFFLASRVEERNRPRA